MKVKAHPWVNPHAFGTLLFDLEADPGETRSVAERPEYRRQREAFHAEVTEFALRVGERTPEDFLRHFSCRAIMRSLEARPMERARIVSQSTGVHEKVAHKINCRLVAPDELRLQIHRLREGDTDFVFQPGADPGYVRQTPRRRCRTERSNHHIAAEKVSG